jgi:hypothetical protein
MSMATHANTTDTLPKHRYLNGLQNYHFDSPSEVIVVCNQDTMFMSAVPDLGIAAGGIRVDGTPVSVQGTLAVPRATHVAHDPTRGQRGAINIETDF